MNPRLRRSLLAPLSLALATLPAPARQPETPAPPPSQPAAAASKPSGAVEIWFDRASGVTSAWLANGILVHHKRLPPPADAPAPDGARSGAPKARMAVCLTLAGAELLETPENRGVSDAAVAASWNARSVRSAPAPEIRAALEHASISLRSYAAGDSFLLTGSTTAESLEPALHAMRLFLTEPVVNPDELTRWRERAIESIEERRSQGNDALEQVIAAMFGPQEARARRPARAAIESISAAAAQAWMDNALGLTDGSSPAPIEVAFAGDLSVAQALSLAETYLGPLPARPRMASATFADRRVALRAERPPEVISLPTWKGAPLVLVGFFGADIRDIADHRALSTAARILDERLDERLPADQLDAEQAFAMATPASVYPGFGLFLASTRAKEGADLAAADNIRKLLDDLMTAGPSAAELSKASQDLAESAAKAVADPVYWARSLARSTYHAVPIGELGRAPDAYRDMPASAIQEALRKYWTGERAIKLIVRGAPPSER